MTAESEKQDPAQNSVRGVAAKGLTSVEAKLRISVGASRSGSRIVEVAD
jgi:hypothetical protein